MSGTERVVILVKAAPHPSRRYQETVCCAGVTTEGEWRRLYPVRFRHLTDDDLTTSSAFIQTFKLA